MNAGKTGKYIDQGRGFASSAIAIMLPRGRHTSINRNHLTEV